METTEHCAPEHKNEDDRAEGPKEEKDLTFTEIEIEEVAIDGICGVY